MFNILQSNMKKLTFIFLLSVITLTAFVAAWFFALDPWVTNPYRMVIDSNEKFSIEAYVLTPTETTVRLIGLLLIWIGFIIFVVWRYMKNANLALLDTARDSDAIKNFIPQKTPKIIIIHRILYLLGVCLITINLPDIIRFQSSGFNIYRIFALIFMGFLIVGVVIVWLRSKSAHWMIISCNLLIGFFFFLPLWLGAFPRPYGFGAFILYLEIMLLPVLLSGGLAFSNSVQRFYNRA